MQTEVNLIPILDDNYVFLLSAENQSKVCLVDPGEAKQCLEVLHKNQLDLQAILITHHHADHIDGIIALKERFPRAQVFAPIKNKGQIPAVDHYVEDGRKIDLEFFRFQTIELPGHTLGILGYFEYQRNWLFSGDVLFGLGCGRLFEGTPQMLFHSLGKIKQLPSETLIFCTHEYTSTNLRFTEMLISERKIPKKFNPEIFQKYKKDVSLQRSLDKPTVPLQLSIQLKCNPFLLAETVEELAELRAVRNHFR